MIRSLQVCRAAAALLVVLYHASESIFQLPKYFPSRPLGHLCAFGGAGVGFFFVLSGFIIAHVHWDDVGNRHRLRAYLRKRFTRIYPTYWAVLLPVLAVFLLVPGFGDGHERQPLTILCSTLLLPLPASDPVLIVSWTLAFEVFFYLGFGLLIASRRWGAVIVTAWLAVIAAHLIGRLTAFPWSFLGAVHNLQFLAGVLLALVVARYRVPVPRLLMAVGVTLFLATGLIEDYIDPNRGLGHVAGYTVGSLLLLAGAIQAERSGQLRPHRFLVFLGDASYSIYLVHFPALSLLAKTAKLLHCDVWMPSLMLFALLVAGATFAGCVFHVAVERPLLRYFRRPAARADASGVPQRQAA